MAIEFNGVDQYAAGGRVPPMPAQTMIVWVKRVADAGAVHERFFASDRGAGASPLLCAEFVNSPETWRPRHLSGSGSQSAATLTTNVWYGFWARYTPESNPGVSADGRVDISYLTDPDSGFIETLTMTGLSDITNLQDYVIGNAAPNGSGSFLPHRHAMWKIWDTHDALTVTQALDELRYRNPQQPAWASHAFRTGALATDDSGNARHLTLVESPTFSFDEPAGILGDDPGGGGGIIVALPTILSGATLEQLTKEPRAGLETIEVGAEMRTLLAKTAAGVGFYTSRARRRRLFHH